MKSIVKFLTAKAFFAFAFSTLSLNAAYTLKDGRLVNANLIATMSLEEHYNAGIEAMKACDWRETARQFGIVSINFPLSPYSREAAFYQGVAEYYLEEYEAADEAFAYYLQGKNTPSLFEETIEFKFAIAEKFRCGAKRRLFGTRMLPKFGSGDGQAIKIYDEIIAAVPCHELAARSLYAKGLLHRRRNEFSDAVECYQMIIRRFPKHELCPESFLMINAIYLDQCRIEFQNPDILAFAEINLNRFKQSFPREERIPEAEEKVLQIKEVYANGFLRTGYFYERVGKPEAAMLYYRYAALQFPETKVAEFGNRRLSLLGYSPVSNRGEQSDNQPEPQGFKPEDNDTEIEWL